MATNSGISLSRKYLIFSEQYSCKRGYRQNVLAVMQLSDTNYPIRGSFMGETWILLLNVVLLSASLLLLSPKKHRMLYRKLNCQLASSQMIPVIPFCLQDTVQAFHLNAWPYNFWEFDSEMHQIDSNDLMPLHNINQPNLLFQFWLREALQQNWYTVFVNQ